MMTDYKPWTTRCVYFTPHPRTPEERLDAFFESLPEFFWRGLVERVLGALGISSSSGVMCVDGWPWWVPGFAARNAVAMLAKRANVGGEAVYVVERCVLADKP